MNLAATLLWYGENIGEFLLQMLPCMGGACLGYLLLRPGRKGRLARLGLVSSRRREGALLLFVMFCAGLAALTLFPAYFWTGWYWRAVLRGEKPPFPSVDLTLQWQSIQLNPFQEVLRAFRGPWVMFLMLANIGIFCPMGFFPALLWRKPRWWKSLLAGFLASCAIEFVQFFIGRSTDVDDVLLNTAGALAGYWLFCLLRAAFPRWTEEFQCKEEKKRDG